MTKYRKTFQKLASLYSITEFYCFGSRSKDVYNSVMNSSELATSAESDIDIAVTMPYGRHLRAEEKVKITITFEELFNAHRVDLIILDEAPPFLALDIIKGELIYCTDPIGQ